MMDDMGGGEGRGAGREIKEKEIRRFFLFAQ
jgi:hypothetical protein